ncbi:methyltransferase domain-containing protein [Planctomycetota bacterium]|nr:methyltransferase domain-containing protein [Planctomycetota bacterium]
MSWPKINSRHLIGELMDDPSLPRHMHIQALRGLERINKFSRTSFSIGNAIKKLTQDEPEQPIRILDVACGGGDVVVGLAKFAARHKLPWKVIGCDISEVALDCTKQKAQKAKIQIGILQHDVISYPIPDIFDVMTCSLFLHHLTDEHIIKLLNQMMVAKHIVISDLVRGNFELASTWLGVRILSRSHIVHVDGPRSIQAALTISELTCLARSAGLEGAKIESQFPMRMLMQWSQS